ncbi:MAG: DNA methylase N-4 [Alphaproteobacteria bacterium]|nr:DNA methylase N-4 [Alphaproteobacteria bacterium]
MASTRTWTRLVEPRPIAALKPYKRNARTHSKRQVKKIAASLEAFGFVNPVLIDEEGCILAGHGRVAAAKLLGWTEVPTLLISHLSPAQKRAYVLADNRLAEDAGWDKEMLVIELQGLLDEGFSLETTGFELAEIDSLFDEANDKKAPDLDRADETPPLPASGACVSRRSDLWLLGDNRLYCGNALEAASYAALMAGETAALVFTDPPYNVPIAGHVSGLGKAQHRDFAMAVGEMTPAEFEAFLKTAFGHMAAHSKDGAIHFVCMDWRHMREALAAGAAIYSELKNLIIWAKSNGGMGTFYRSRHELIFAFKHGAAPHTNNFELGQTGRHRTNVWDYAGVNAFGAARDAELAMHHTVKPVALIADALKDCSKRGEIVLDAFGGSGSTLIAAEKTGRRARLLELDPAYCDTIIRRWQNFTGKRALLAGENRAFEDVEEARTSSTPSEERSAPCAALEK